MSRRVPYALVIAVLVAVLVLPAAATAAPRDGAVVYSFGSCVREACEGGLFAVGPAGRQQLTADVRDREPAVSPDGRTVAFVRGGAIYAMPFAPGVEPTRLTTGPSPDSEPAFSSDGSFLLFRREEGPPRVHKLYRLDLATRIARRLTGLRSAIDESEPDFSPDRKLIAFTGRTVSGNSITATDIYSVRPGGEDLVPLTHGPAIESHPHYCNLGIVFTRRDPRARRRGNRIFAMRRNGRRGRLLLPEVNVGVVDVSGNGLRLLYNGRRGLSVKGLRKLPRRLTRGRLVGPGGDGTVLSPSGREIATVGAPHAMTAVRKIDVRTGADRFITPLVDLEGPGSTFGWYGHAVAWQPLP